MRDGGVSGINSKRRKLMVNFAIVKLIFHLGPFFNLLVAGRFLRSTYVAPAPPSHNRALVKAITHFRQSPVVSHL